MRIFLRRWELLIVLAVAAVYHFLGAGWGIPDRERITLVVGAGDKLEPLIPVLENLHQELEEMIPYYGRKYPRGYRPGEPVKITLSGRVVIVRKDVLNAVRSFLFRSYGADEHRALLALSRMKPSRMNFDPKFYEYGGGYLYPLGAFLKLCSATRLIKLRPEMSFYLDYPEEMGRVFVASRIFGASGAIGAVLLFFLLMEMVAPGRPESFLFSLSFAVMPVFVIWSFHLKPFSFGLLWVVATLALMVKARESLQTGWLKLASLCAGLAMGTLLSYGYVFWAILLAVIAWPERFLFKVRLLVQCGLIFLAVFILVNPYAVWHWREFLGELTFLKDYWHTGSRLEPLVFFLQRTMRIGMGTALYFLSALSCLGCLCYRREREDWFWLLYLGPGLLYFGATTGYWMHYSFFLFPVLLIISRRFCARVKAGLAVRLALVVVVVWTILYAGALAGLYRGENLRTLAGRWINAHIPPGASIGI
ncbi:MAG TPA: hypothetical protein PKX93_07055, partial [bacterium]|nr:hypothetical protein [bacterium]